MRRRGIDPSTRPGELALGGAVTGGSEALRLGSMTRLLPASMRNRLASGMMTRILGQGAEEATQETAEAITHNLIAMGYEEEAKLFEGALHEGGIAGASAMVFQSLVEAAVPGRSRAESLLSSEIDREIAVKDTEAQDRVSRIFDAANKLKTLQRSPEATASLLDEIAGGTDVETVTIDLDGIGPALQEAGIDPLEALTGLGLDDAALKQAYDIGGEIEVRTSALLTSPLMRESRQHIEPHVRHNGDEFTPAKREAAEAELETEIQNIVAEGRKGMEEAGSAVEADDQVRDLVTQRLQQGGAVYAQQDVANAEIELMTAMNNTLARALGRDPVEFFNERFPDVRASLSEEQGAEVLEQGDFSKGEYPTAPRDEWYGDANYRDTGGRAVRMSPDEFLERVRPLELDDVARDNIDDLKRHIQDGRTLDPLQIQESGKEDGRHRAYAAKELGISSVPVLVWGNEDITAPEEVLQQARANGYEGQDLEGAQEWEAARAKGLDMSPEGRMTRAKEMGFDTDTVLYHGTKSDFDAFKVGRPGKLGPGVYFSPDKRWADHYAKVGSLRPDPPRTIEAFVRGRMANIDQYKNAYKRAAREFTKTGYDPSTRANEILREEGFDGVSAIGEVVIFDPSNIRSVNAAFDPDMSDSANLLHQQARGTFSPNRNLVTLFDQRNASTLMHELSHWYLNELQQMAAEGSANDFAQKQLDEIDVWYRKLEREGKLDHIKARYRIAEEAGGFQVYYNGNPMEKTATLAEAEEKVRWREVHETFAETFEAYLRDGKAPTANLRDAFRVFKRWFTSIYRRLTGLERANLTPEIRSVMDRMVASEEAIEAASKPVETLADQQAKAMLDAGIITEKQYDNFRKRIESARESAKEDLLQVLMQQHLREGEAWYRDEKKRVRGDITREFDRSQIGRAWNWLAGQGWKGDVPDTESTGENEFYQDGGGPQPQRSLEALYRSTTFTPGTSNGKSPLFDRVVQAARQAADDIVTSDYGSKDGIPEEVDLLDEAGIEHDDEGWIEEAVFITSDIASAMKEMGVTSITAGQYREIDSEGYARHFSGLDNPWSRLTSDDIIMEFNDYALDDALSEDGSDEAAYIRIAAGVAERIGRGVAAEVNSLESAFEHPNHHVRAAAFRALLDEVGIEYSTAGYEGINSEYVFAEGANRDEIKIRFSDHERQSRLHAAADYNFANNQFPVTDYLRVADDLAAAQMVDVKFYQFTPEEIKEAETRMDRAERQGFTIKAYRGTRARPTAEGVSDRQIIGGGWFTDSPDTANTYARPHVGAPALAMEARIRLRNPMVIDAKGKHFDQIPVSMLKGIVPDHLLKGRRLVASDSIVLMAKHLGHDGVIFKNMKDDFNTNAITTKPATIYTVFNDKDIRSAFAAFDDAKSEEAGLLYQGADPAPTFFSALHRFVQSAKQPKAPADQWKAILSKAPGIKAEEIEWTGVNEWLDAQEGSVTRDDLAVFLEQNGVQVEEVVKGAGANDARIDEIQRELLPLIDEQNSVLSELRAGGLSGERMAQINDRSLELHNQMAPLRAELRNLQGGADDTQWSTWTLPGGENYREMLLTLPSAEQGIEARALAIMGGRKFNELSEAEQQHITALNEQLAGAQDYKSSHWSEPNVVAHVRFKERVTADGQRTLALEEIQSDWHQAGRQQGYKGEADLTEETFGDWYARVGVKLTGEESLDALSGDMVNQMHSRYLRSQDAERSRQSRRVPNAPFKNNAWTTLALKRMIRWAAENGFDSVSWIPGNVQNGQEVDAEDGRSDFYDKIVPNLANKLGKKYGAKVEKVAVEGAGYKVTLPNGKVLSDNQPTRQSAEAIARNFEGAVVAPAHEFWSLPITPGMREAALEKGFPLFQRGDPKGWGETSPPPDLPPIRLDLSAVREDYGEDAVRRLPRAIRERSAAGSDVTDMLETIRGVRKTLKRKPPKSLSAFIRSKGKQGTISSPGVRGPNGIKGSASELKAMGLENLINETSGMDIDYVREMATEVGYLEDGATINDLLDALDRESRGDPVYRADDMAQAEDIGNAEAWQDWLSENGVDIFEASEKVLRKQVSDFVTQNGEGAMSPDAAAELLGFSSGEALLKALAEVGSRERYLNELTRREMNREFGNMMEDGTLEMEARQMAEAELVSRHAEIELEALARAVGEVAAGRMAKQMAKDALALMTVKEIRANGRFLQAERREMRNALDATRKGNYAQAFIHKRRQLVNMHLYNEARKAADKLEKHRRDLQKYETSESRRKSIAPDYREKIDALLEAYELRVSKQGPKEQRRRLSAAQWVLEMTEQGRESEITPEAFLLAQAAEDKVWSTLTLEEAEYLVATVANMAHLGKLKERLLNEREKRAFSAVIDGLVGTLEKAPTNKDREQNVSATVGERTATWLRKAHARLTRMEFQFARLDGGENGALFNALWRPMAEAADRETVMARDGAKKMNALYEAYSPRERGRLFSQRVDAPELEWPGKKSPTRMDIITVGLNWGNEGNRAALLEGYGWDEAAVETMLNRVLTDKDWDFIEGVWSLIGEYRDPAFTLEKKITGVAPKAVEGVTFTLASGREIKGQYYPLKYSTDAPTPKAVTQQRLEEKDMLADLGKTYSKPMTKTGHLKERVGSGGKRVKLSISVFHEHVQNVIHDINYRPAVIDAHKIIQNERFAQAYINAAGREQYDMLRPWIAAVATERAEEPGGFVTDIMQRARRNFSIVAMGYKIGTATQQLTGILAAPALIGTKYTTQGFLKAFGGNPASFWGSWQWVSEKSEFMRDRPQGFDRDVRMVTNKMQERTPLGKMQRNAFIFIGMMDTAVSTGAWIGAYDKAMDGKVKGIEAGNEEDAIVYADSVIRRTQVAGRMQDLPQIMRGTELEKLMTSVYSYFSGLYNLTAAQIQDVRGGQVHPAAFAANMALLFVVIPMLAEVLAGRFPPPDDEDEPGEKAAKALVSNAVSTVPFLRDIVNAGMNPQFGYNMSPAGSIIDRAVQGVARAADGIESEYEARLALDSLGVLFGLPTGQLWITGEYAYGVATGEEDPSENPADALREATLKDTR
tara:strand:- start:1370 stop:10480 length:9111 start_codon:yes stop_codon:yes gene_type:complete